MDFLNGPRVPYSNRDEFVISSALRWCSLRPLSQKDTIVEASLEKTIDAFIDHWLYFLPLPRYGPSLGPLGLSDVNIFNCFLISIKREKVCEIKENKLGQINNLFKKYWPHLDSLRDLKANMNNIGLMLCLMALDRESCEGLETKILFSDKYTIGFIRSISEETKIKFADNSIIQILDSVHRYLIHKKEALVPALADDTWTSYLTAKDRGLLNRDIDERAKLFLNQMSEKYNILESKLEARCAIKNFIDEVPEISLFTLKHDLE